MRTASFAAAINANQSTETLTYRNTSTFRAFAAIIKKAKSLWRCKIAVELAQRTGSSVRSAENWLAGHRAMNGEAVLSLIMSDEGFDFLEAIVDSMPPRKAARWRAEFERAARRADLRARQEALREELEREGLQ